MKGKTTSAEDRLAAALVPAEEQPYRVPGNWCWTQLQNVVKWGSGGTPSRKNTDYYQGTVPWIKTGELNDEFIYESDERITELALQHSSAKLFPKNTVIIAMYGATIGKTGILGVEAATNQACACGISTNSIYFKFLFYYLISEKSHFIKLSKGGAQPNISQEIIKEHLIPLPPLPEQHRIVEHIESLFTRLDEARDEAQAVIDGYEDRKAAILHRAFTGELTEEWRLKNGIDLKCWESSTWDAILSNIEAGTNWNANAQPPQANEFGVVKVSAVTWGEFNENESKTCVLEEQWNEKVQIKKNDFLFSRANTIQLVGNCVIVNSITKRLMLSDKILRLSFNESIVIPRYILHFTRSDQYRTQVEELASGNQDGMRNVSQKNMRSISTPIPTLPEQHEIVRRLDTLLNAESTIKSAAEAVINTIDTLKQSILARAFRGELGTNDPTDEPAINLLKQVLS